MTFCGGCGTENPNGELYCYKCGRRLHNEEHQPTVENIVKVPHHDVHRDDLSYAGLGSSPTEPPVKLKTRSEIKESPNLEESDEQSALLHRTVKADYDRIGSGKGRTACNRREFDHMRYAILVVSGLCFVIGLYTLFGLGLEYRSLDTFSLFEESNTFYGLATGDWLTGLDQYFFWFLVIVVLIGIIIPTPAVLGASLMYFGLCMTTAEEVPVLHDVMLADMELTNGATVIGIGIVLLILGIAYLLLFSGFENRYADKDKGDLLMLIWTGHR